MDRFDALFAWVHVCLVIAAICTTMFPILYSLSPWRSTRLGQVLMLQGIAFALAMDLTALFTFWVPPSFKFRLIIDGVVLTFIAVTTSALTILLYLIQHGYTKDAHRRRYDD